MKKAFPTDTKSIHERLASIDPVRYSQTRNYVTGAVTRLSPYMSRGFLSTKQVLHHLIDSGLDFESCETLVRELAWREYFQRVWQKKSVDNYLRQPQVDVRSQGIPRAVSTASTGITGVDLSIKELIDTGYMHNHCRMYTASITCNVARYGWHEPARWMYYHLLDGDWASNACSWQWVAGSNSSKKYFANQENISRYTGKKQTGTFLDVDYGLLPFIPVPENLVEATPFQLTTELPSSDLSGIDPKLPVLLFNYYNIDPNWMPEREANRILFFETDVFERYPVSKACIEFSLQLSANIPGIRIFSGSWSELSLLIDGSEIHYKEHPLNEHYQGIRHERDWMCPEVSGYFPSFSGYWNKAERHFRKKFITTASPQSELEFETSKNV
ncbi:MAG: hypothetical protein RL161_726 [Bacteroidota bacterium]|jgi:deoxyribodipyrimidine photo-lyase